jgi:hypothetical protein
MKKENVVRLFKELSYILATLVVFPLSLSLYLSDRIICVVLIHLESKPLGVWQKNIDNVVKSVYRVVGAGVIYGLYKLVVWIL